MPPLNLYTRVRFVCTILARETAGAARTRLSLRPLFDEGGKKQQTPGKTRRGNAKVCSAVMARSVPVRIATVL